MPPSMIVNEHQSAFLQVISQQTQHNIVCCAMILFLNVGVLTTVAAGGKFFTATVLGHRRQEPLSQIKTRDKLQPKQFSLGDLYAMSH